ncbi:hypothetical protein [Sorangium sp. So ce341]|uniref:hypothetical protein n=1 Tax=Sorangium sp. So ce341 TaxID=3133302 RepID=UPI003F633033
MAAEGGRSLVDEGSSASAPCVTSLPPGGLAHAAGDVLDRSYRPRIRLGRSGFGDVWSAWSPWRGADAARARAPRRGGRYGRHAGEAAPEVVVLSVMAYGQEEVGEAIGVAFLAAAAELDEERRALYGDLVRSSLNEAARRTLEAMMKGGYEFQSEFARSYVAKGVEKGREEGVREGTLKTKAQAVLVVLKARGLEVPAEVRERVLVSTDVAELDRWLRRAAVVSDARELLATNGS